MSIKEITVSECKNMIKDGHVLLVDVRPREIAHEPPLPTRHNIPLAELQWEELAPMCQEGESLIFICQRGITSMKAALLVSQQGYQGTCYSVSGGFSEW